MQQAVADLYRRHGPMVHRRCRALLRDEEDAMEATQEVFVKVMRTGELPEHASSYLYRAATHTCLNRIRTRRRRPEEPIDPLVQAIAMAPEAEGRVGALRLLDRVFSREQPSTRTMATLHFVDGWTLEEVAAETGLSLSGVRARLRALKANVAALEGVAWND